MKVHMPLAKKWMAHTSGSIGFDFITLIAQVTCRRREEYAEDIVCIARSIAYIARSLLYIACIARSLPQTL